MNTQQIENAISPAYSGIVGQARLISNRLLAHCAYAMGSDAPISFLLCGAAGLGKTHFLRADLQARAASVKIRRQREAETLFLRSPQEIRLAGDAYFGFIEQAQNGDGITIDELHEVDIASTKQARNVKALIKGLLDNGAPPLRTVKLDDDTIVSRHISEIYWAAGTNYPERIKDGPAIISRFGGETALALYSADELTSILMLMAAAAGLKIVESTIALIARCGRGTARPLESIVAHLARVAVTQGKATINRADALDAMRSLGLFPLGVSEREVSILLRSKGAGIAARMLPLLYAVEPKGINASVSFLASLGFVSVRAGIVTLAPKGDAYLQQLHAEKFALPST